MIIINWHFRLNNHVNINAGDLPMFDHLLLHYIISVVYLKGVSDSFCFDYAILGLCL